MLSALMLKHEVLDEVSDLLQPEDFLHGPHRSVYQAILQIDRDGNTIDPVTLAAQLRTDGEFARIGGGALLAQLMDATPSVANVMDHARIVRGLGLLRRMSGTLRDLTVTANAVETRGNVPAFLERCEADVFAATGGGNVQRETGSMMHELMAQALTELDPQRPREPRGLTTGFHQLDALSLGLGRGELWYVAGRPGMGKTSLALAMLHAVAKTQRHALLFSLEMSRTELKDRMISMTSGVPHTAIVSRELSDQHYHQACDAISDLGKLPILIDDDPRITPARLRSRIRRRSAALRARYPFGLGLVIVDYVQLMTDDERKGSNRQDELERISRGLKLLAREFEVPMVVLSQMNRGAASADAAPKLSDLRGSGSLEQDADKVLFVHREADGPDSRGTAELILAKARNAPTGKVPVKWQPWCSRFMDSEQGGFVFDPRAGGDDFGPTNYGD